jgi:hypothetical protein
MARNFMWFGLWPTSIRYIMLLFTTKNSAFSGVTGVHVYNKLLFDTSLISAVLNLIPH